MRRFISRLLTKVKKGTSDTTKELKECPMCGGRAELFRYIGAEADTWTIEARFCVRCRNCGLETRDYRHTVRLDMDGDVWVSNDGAGMAIADWNRRDDK